MIKTPEDVEGKSIEELQKLHREIGFQLKIVNNALKDHVRESKMRQFFEKYPYYLDRANDIHEADIEFILGMERAGFGYNTCGLPVWSENYGASGEEFVCIEKKEDAPRIVKLQEVVENVIALHNKNEPTSEKVRRLNKILEGFQS